MADYSEASYDWNNPDLVSVYDELPLWSAMFGLVLLKLVKLRPKLTIPMAYIEGEKIE